MRKWFRYILGLDWETISEVKEDRYYNDFDAWYQPTRYVSHGVVVTQTRVSPKGKTETRTFWKYVSGAGGLM